ncbi:TPA: hypothetical protein WM899_002194 [Neisseria gonorrhoeae]|jgi:hypothetical protein
MSTNVIPLKEKLDFYQYQTILKFLDNMGIEVEEPEYIDFYYELSDEDIEKIKKSEQQIKESKTITNEALFNKLESKYGN